MPTLFPIDRDQIQEETDREECLAYGDQMCMFHELTKGYIYSDRTRLFKHIPFVKIIIEIIKRCPFLKKTKHSTITFEICVQNRYKLNKKYMKLKKEFEAGREFLNKDEIEKLEKSLRDVYVTVEAEKKDNIKDQERLRGKALRYGEIIQLRHIFTNKFIHVSASDTSHIMKNKSIVKLEDYSDKGSWFRILPRGKIKVSGEKIEYSDEVVFESGGTVLRLFHKELESYLCAVGVFGQDIEEDVHFRVRVIDQSDTRTLQPSTSSNIYWQIEKVDDVTSGEAVLWKEQIRLRHLTTRKFLSLNAENKFVLVDNIDDPRTLLTFYPLAGAFRDEKIDINSNIRIFHVISKSWVHGSGNNYYTQKNKSTLYNDTSELLEVTISPISEFPDVLAIQQVAYEDFWAFNYVAGMVPYLRSLVEERANGAVWKTRDDNEICKIFKEFREFLQIDGQILKQRQKLLRNLHILEISIKLLSFPISNELDEKYLNSIFCTLCQLFVSYSEGKSRKNARHISKYLEFFRKNIEGKNYKMLEFLGCLCVCENTAMTENQNFICKSLFVDMTDIMFKLRKGSSVDSDSSNILYISTDAQKTWQPLHRFVSSGGKQNPLQYLYYEKQLELYGKMCFGQNEYALNIITTSAELFSWETALAGLISEQIAYSFRSKFCDIITSLFIDIVSDSDVIRTASLNFLYEEVTTDLKKSNTSRVARDINAHFPHLRCWIFEFLSDHKVLIANNIGRNQFIGRVLNMIKHLIKFGYIGSAYDIDALLPLVLSILSGFNDLPSSPDEGSTYSIKARHDVNNYKLYRRYEKSEKTDQLLLAKKEALELIELLMINQFNRKVKQILSIFKEIDQKELLPVKQHHPLGTFLEKVHSPSYLWNNVKYRRVLKKLLKDISRSSDSLFSVLPQILMDLTRYSSEEILFKVIEILDIISSDNNRLFEVVEKCQILCSTSSIRVHRQVLSSMPKLLQCVTRKITQDNCQNILTILEQYTELCYAAYDENVTFTVGQNIMINNEVLAFIYNMISKSKTLNISIDDDDAAEIRVLKASLKLLKYLTRKNAHVQKYVFDRFDDFMSIKHCGSSLAIAMMEVFRGHVMNCFNIKKNHVRRIIRLVGVHQQRAPELLHLLSGIVRERQTGVLIKKNQLLVVQEIMTNYPKIAYCLSYTIRRRMNILIGHEGKEHESYLVELVRLLAICAEGENRYIENFCQTLFSTSELLTILNNRYINMRNKGIFAKYLTWAYLKTARSEIESGVDQFTSDFKFWQHLKALRTLLNRLQLKVNVNSTIDENGENRVASDERIDELCTYFLDGGLEMLNVYLSKYYKSEEQSHEQEFIIRKLINLLKIFFPSIIQNMTTLNHCHIVYTSFQMFLLKTKESQSEISEFFSQNNFSSFVETIEQRSDHVEEIYDSQEKVLKGCLKNFVSNCKIIIQGKDTLSYVLNIKSEQRYNHEDKIMFIPVNEEFQQLVNIFDDDFLCSKLIDFLKISTKKNRNVATDAQEKLEMKCMDILSALLYNRILAVEKSSPSQEERKLCYLRQRQCQFVEYGIIPCLMDILVRDSDPIRKKVMVLFDRLLYNALNHIQVKIMEYCKSTKEEIFFLVLETFLKRGAIESKERRSLRVQIQQKSTTKYYNKDKNSPENKSLAGYTTDDNSSIKTATSNNERKAKGGNWVALARQRKSLAFITMARTVLANRMLPLQRNNNRFSDSLQSVELKELKTQKDPTFIEQQLKEFVPDGSTELIIRVLGGLCSGQYLSLQLYLRCQDDNLRKVILNNKVIDFINFLLRMKEYKQCTPRQVLKLWLNISNLLRALVEENSSEAIALAKDVAATLDFSMLKKVIQQCYEIKEASKPNYLSLIGEEENQEATSKRQSDLDGLSADCGFSFYLLSARLLDIDKKLKDRYYTTARDKAIWDYYKKNCGSIEIVKDDCLQKVHFRIKTAGAVREEVKEVIKWNTDRSSATSKLRDLIKWGKDTLNVVPHQKRLLDKKLFRQVK
ncbi:DgyrCDS13086 [Dimorphilus gyrociliatus]|uniref:DgyrCDS13086 n=1 Tax=Dimorphilus gyrociliatus TaxID=2664684 RepID=A0A7I8W9L7_9ANNE|nr:DgyrCDS13086 [Dimorphilus gyrociliatus]